MNPSNYNPWPITGAARVVFRILTALVILFYLLCYPLGISDFWEYNQRGRVGIQFDRMPDQTFAVIALAPGGSAEQAGVKIGDRIIQVDELVLKPETTVDEVVNQMSGVAGQPVNLRLRTADNQERSVTLTRIKFLPDLVNGWTSIAQMVVFAVCGLIIFWTRRRSGYALFVSLGLIILGVSISGVSVYQAGLGMFLFYGLGFALMLFVLLTYPSGRLAPAWILAIGVLGVIFYGLSLFPAPLDPYEWSWKYYVIAQAILFGSALTCQIFNYQRRATPDEKTHMRPAFWGAVSALGVFFLFYLIYNLPGIGDWLYLHPFSQSLLYIINVLGYVLLPIMLAISMLRNGQAAKGKLLVEPPANQEADPGYHPS